MLNIIFFLIFEISKPYQIFSISNLQLYTELSYLSENEITKKKSDMILNFINKSKTYQLFLIANLLLYYNLTYLTENRLPYCQAWFSKISKQMYKPIKYFDYKSKTLLSNIKSFRK